MKNPNNIINETNEDVKLYLEDYPKSDVFIETALLKAYLMKDGLSEETAFSAVASFASFLFHGICDKHNDVTYGAIEFERMLQEQTLKTMDYCDCHCRRNKEFDIKKVLDCVYN